MSIYVYITENCKKDAANHSISERIDELKQKVENTQEISNFKPLQHSGFLKKPFGKAYRLFMYEHVVDDDSILVFLSLLAKSHPDEKKWTYNDDFRKVKYDEISNEKEIHRYLKSRKVDGPLDPQPEPNTYEKEWLTDVFSTDDLDDDIIVLETKDWIEKTTNDEFQEVMAVLRSLLEKIDLKKSSEMNIQLEWNEEPEIGILYRYFSFLRYILLLKPIINKDKIETIVNENSKLVDIELLEDKEENRKDLLQIAHRAYPQYISIDKHAWRAVQKGKESNLALSPEESSILKKIKKPTDDSPLFPLFINGRAGSGKSTLLHYLMKDYIEFSEKKRGDIYPCYLTQSENLLETAKNNISQLLESHYTSLINDEGNKNRSYDKIKNKSFHVFHELVLSTLPEELKKSRFVNYKYVTYIKFKNMWQDKFGYRPKNFREKFNPDICWHVIRTYIKGMAESEGSYFEKSDYFKLPRDQKTVTEQIFAEISDKIWKRWYKGECQKGHWDDQDLVMTAIEHGDLTDSYGAILCDESQDFTLIEIEFIYYLSLFSKKSLYPHQMKRVPFVFAGDPLQTLNPTGFRWESLRNLFYVNIIRRIDRNNRARIEFNYKDLNHNYRSIDQIVRFCNIILLMRSHFFNMQNIIPQKPWRNLSNTGIRVSFHDVEHNQTEKLLRSIDIVKIVRCENDVEGEFVKEDEYLSKIIQSDEEGVPMDVLSPSASKGLEYEKVILYGFGDSAMKDSELMKFLYSGEPYDPDKHLPFEYFFNSLYVAVSRAKGFLYIVDHIESFRKFWDFACKPETLKTLTRGLIERKPEEWDNENLYFLQDHTGMNIEDSNANPEELAKSFKEQGLKERSPSYLRRARLLYSNINKEKDAKECFAYALKYEEKFEGAGKEFRGLHEFEKAINCFWIGRCFKEIVQLGHDEHDLDTFKLRASQFMEMDSNIAEIQSFIDDVIHYCKDEDNEDAIINDSTMDRVVNEMVVRAVKAEKNVLTPEKWRYMYKQMDKLDRQDFNINKEKLAQIAFRAGDYPIALRLWGKENESDGDYITAKIETENFPDNLQWLAKKGKKAEIIKEWTQNHKPSDLDTQEIKLLFDTLASDPDYLPDASELMVKRPKDVGSGNIINILLKQYNPEDIDIEAAIEIQIHILFEQGQILEALSLQEKKKIESLASPEVMSESINNLDSLILKNQKAIVREIAVSGDLPGETLNVQKQVSDFLRSLFCKDSKSKILIWDRFSGYSTHDVAGAAIERAGRIIDALSFYEWLRKNGSESQQDFAKERLIKCRLRRAVSLGNDGRPEEGARAIRELEENIIEWGTKRPEEITEYPEISYKNPEIKSIFRKNKDAQQSPTIEESNSVRSEEIPAMVSDNGIRKGGPSNTKLQFSSFKLNFDENSQFEVHLTDDGIRIDNTQEFSYAKYFLKDNTIRGGQFIMNENGEWYSESWALNLRILIRQASIEVELYRGDIKISFPIL